MTGPEPAPVILRGDARYLPLADNSVDLIVTSPPYFGLRSYTDNGEHYTSQIGAETTPAEFLDALVECTREMMRVLKPTGSIWVNLGDKYGGTDGTKGGTSRSTLAGTANGRPRSMRQGTFDGGGQKAPGRQKSLLGIPWRYALRCVDELGLILRAEVIWLKPNGLPESVTDRVRRSHEQWFHFVVQPRYYSSVDEIREPYAPASLAAYAKGGLKSSIGATTHPSKSMQARQRLDGESLDSWAGNPLGRLPGSVWEIPTQPLKVPPDLGVDHFAAFPMEWPRRIICGWCPPGGIVLDPFGGTGTTALVAAMHNRTGITVDASADYCRISSWRASNPKERGRAAGLDPDAVARIETPIKGQVSMFDLFGAVS